MQATNQLCIFRMSVFMRSWLCSGFVYLHCLKLLRSESWLCLSTPNVKESEASTWLSSVHTFLFNNLKSRECSKWLSLAKVWWHHTRAEAGCFSVSFALPFSCLSFIQENSHFIHFHCLQILWRTLMRLQRTRLTNVKEDTDVQNLQTHLGHVGLPLPFSWSNFFFSS